jgi:hypothetical protein
MLLQITGTTPKTALDCGKAPIGLTAERQRHLLQFARRAGRFVFLGRKAGQTQRRIAPGALINSAAASQLFGCTRASASSRLSLRTEFARTLEKRETFRFLGFLGAGVLAFVFRTDELSVHEDMVALVERCSDGLAEAVEGQGAVPFGLACHSSFASFRDSCVVDGWP